MQEQVVAARRVASLVINGNQASALQGLRKAQAPFRRIYADVLPRGQKKENDKKETKNLPRISEDVTHIVVKVSSYYSAQLWIHHS